MPLGLRLRAVAGIRILQKRKQPPLRCRTVDVASHSLIMQSGRYLFASRSGALSHVSLRSALFWTASAACTSFLMWRRSPAA